MHERNLPIQSQYHLPELPAPAGFNAPQLAPPRPFEECIAPIYSSLTRILLRVYGNHPDAEDLVQEGLIYLWEQWKQNTDLFEEKIAYLVGMARRGHASEVIQKQKKRAKYHTEDVDLDDDDADHPALSNQGRDMCLADIRLDLSQAAKTVYTHFSNAETGPHSAKKRSVALEIFRDFLDDEDIHVTATKVGLAVKTVAGWRTVFRNAMREAMPNYATPGVSNKRPYTPEEMQQIRNLISEGYTLRQVAAKLGRSHSSVATKWENIKQQSVTIFSYEAHQKVSTEV